MLSRTNMEISRYADGVNDDMNVGVNQPGLSECSRAQSMRCVHAPHLFVGCFEVNPCTCTYQSSGVLLQVVHSMGMIILASYGSDSPSTCLAMLTITGSPQKP